jgi:hypothetical protein
MYSGGIKFKFQPGYQLFGMRIIIVLIQSSYNHKPATFKYATTMLFQNSHLLIIHYRLPIALDEQLK